MSDFLSCAVAEIKALGLRCIVFGPEAWLAIIVVCIFSAGIVVGMWLVALQMLVQQRLILLQDSRLTIIEYK